MSKDGTDDKVSVAGTGNANDVTTTVATIISAITSTLASTTARTNPTTTEAPKVETSKFTIFPRHFKC